MKQITTATRNHQPTNIHTWTPDSQWLVSNVHPSGASFIYVSNVSDDF